MKRRFGPAQRKGRDASTTHTYLLLSATAVALIFLLACAAIFLLPRLLISAEDLVSGESLAQRQNDVRTTGLQALAGLVVTIGALFTGFSVLSSREAQIDDRFTSALRLLGESPDPHIRRGAIYALERIARQSPSERDAVVEVLAAFLRSKSSCFGREAPAPKDAIGHSGTKRLDPDIETALQAVVRTAAIREGITPDLRKVDFNNADLAGVDLSGVDLRESQLVNADLEGAMFVGSDLRLSDMSGSLLHNANLDQSRMRECKISLASMAQASARDADLSDMDASNASFTQTDFTNSELGGTKFEKAAFLGTVLVRARLGHADLSTARLQEINLTDATYNSRSKFPPGFDAEAQGASLEDEEI